MRPLLLLLLLGVLHPLGAQSTPTLHDLGFMSGCWAGSFPNGGTIEERYTPPSDNLLLGTTRYLAEGRAVGFEFTALRVDAEGGIELHPSPNGRPSPHTFRLTRLEAEAESRAVFEAPANDFPKRIVYRLLPGSPDTLLARIDNGEGSREAQEWRMTPVSCVASGSGG